MSIVRCACFLLLACGVAACDDSAKQDCQQPADTRRQVEACTQVISADPKQSKAYNNRCYAYNELQQYEKALHDCNMAIKLAPGSFSAYNNRGVTHEMQGNLDEALKDYDKAVELNPRFAGAMANRGDVYAKKGDRNRAIAEYRAALALEPGNDVALSGLSKLGARP